MHTGTDELAEAIKASLKSYQEENRRNRQNILNALQSGVNQRYRQIHSNPSQSRINERRNRQSNATFSDAFSFLKFIFFFFLDIYLLKYYISVNGYSIKLYWIIAVSFLHIASCFADKLWVFLSFFVYIYLIVHNLYDLDIFTCISDLDNNRYDIPSLFEIWDMVVNFYKVLLNSKYIF